MLSKKIYFSILLIWFINLFVNISVMNVPAAINAGYIVFLYLIYRDKISVT